MEEIKPVVTERYDFEYRDKSILITSFSFWYWLYFDAKNYLIEIPKQFSSLSVAFLIATLMMEIKPVITVKNDF